MAAFNASRIACMSQYIARNLKGTLGYLTATDLYACNQAIAECNNG